MLKDSWPQITYHKCKSCSWTGRSRDLDYDDFDEGGCCPLCGSEDVKYWRVEPASYVSISMYFIDRAYGGPEEGGWYYTTGARDTCTTKCFTAAEMPQASLYMKQLQKRAEGSREIAPRVYAEQMAPTTFPAKRPHYS